MHGKKHKNIMLISENGIGLSSNFAIEKTF